ncbi:MULTISPECIES: acyl carrier protein [Gammaproteobacteria]|jgi:acyl carrier protein|uniref:Carrier domain-containing protein n=1 Tax=Pseudomonas lini TaxID=163011 RepID=A0A423IIJ2_9PSED|nr:MULTISPECIES: acyl carrier protein [Gammaproteobacteria]MBK5304066.1 acyl carrier protein [Bacillus sp. TH86]MBK5323835.1 acyl carrier protein [Bacillus sp. TH59]MBK5338785.1 acyl carrier protein [Bacillus sp. TH57]MBK5312837.1 acyl carrier protein [Pseudomonas sp. TH71]MBK5318333.1 acyl carrier protein [Erwinia sp. TH79]
MTHVHEAKIKEIVSRVLGVNAGEIQNNKNFVEAYGADSMSGIEILAGIEGAFQVRVDEAYIPRITSVDSILSFIDQTLEVECA